MVVHKDTIYLAYKDEQGKPELLRWFTADALKGAVKRGDFLTMRDPKDSRRVLISFDSIPEATRQAKGMPTRDSLLTDYRNQSLTSLVAFNTEAYNFFLQHPDTSKVAKEKAEQASWLIAIASAKPSQCKALGFASKNEFGEAMMVLMDQRHWHAWKCTTLKGLSKKLTPFKKYLKQQCTLAEACQSLISGKYGNSNRAKLEADQHALLVQLYSDANAKPNIEQVHAIYTRKAIEMVRLGHWSEDSLVSVSTVSTYLNKPEIMQMWYEARHGHQQYRNVFEPITQRQRPTYANALWVIDGTPIHRYFQTAEGGKYFRWNFFVVLDAFSQCVLGFWISQQEDSDTVLNALRNACAVTGTLPHQILYDNSSAIQSYRVQEAIDKISVVSFAAKAGNARTKVIESWFHWFNENVGQFRKGFTQNPFAKRLDNQPNREALALMVKNKELSMEADGLRELREDLTLANNTPRKFLGGKSALATYRASVQATQAKQRPFSEIIDIEAFYQLPGSNKKKQVYDQGKKKMITFFEPQLYPFTNKGIEITINKNTFTYDIEDPDFRRLYIGAKFTVRYEPNPERWTNAQYPDELLLYKNGAPLQWNGAHARALAKELVPMAVADYTEGSRHTINERLSNKKKQRALVQQDFEAMIARTKRNGTHTEVITDNAFDKEVLQNTLAQLNNQLIGGEDYKITDESSIQHPASKDLDRLSDYDKPLPLD